MRAYERALRHTEAAHIEANRVYPPHMTERRIAAQAAFERARIRESAALANLRAASRAEQAQ